MDHQTHRRASDEYRNRVDAALKALGLSNFTQSESLIVDNWSCLDFLAEACAESIAIDRATLAAT